MYNFSSLVFVLSICLSLFLLALIQFFIFCQKFYNTGFDYFTFLSKKKYSTCVFFSDLRSLLYEYCECCPVLAARVVLLYCEFCWLCVVNIQQTIFIFVSVHRSAFFIAYTYNLITCVTAFVVLTTHTHMCIIIPFHSCVFHCLRRLTRLST